MQTSHPAARIARWMVPIALVLTASGWLWFTPPGLLGKAAAVGYAVCHRIDERSFHFDGQQTPLCARCSGMYLGAVAGLGCQALLARRRAGYPARSVIVLLALLAAAFIIDGSNSYLYLIRQSAAGLLPVNLPQLYTPNNTLRLFTGSGMGLGIAALLYPAFNQTVWVQPDARPALPDLRAFALLAGLMTVVNLLVLQESPWVLYPAAYISAAGVLLVLALVYSMAWLMIMRQENAFSSARQLMLPFLAGLTVALIQVGAIDLFRFWLTGTWGAFPIG